MDFREATDILMSPCGISHLARALGVSEATVRQARLPEGAKARRNPPKGWEDALAALAKERARLLLDTSAGIRSPNV